MKVLAGTFCRGRSGGREARKLPWSAVREESLAWPYREKTLSRQVSRHYADQVMNA